MMEKLVRHRYSSSFQMVVGGLLVDNLLEKKFIFAIEIFSFKGSLKARKASRRG